MTSGPAQRTGPLPGSFSGDAPVQRAKRLFHATRPKFYPASVLPVLAGTAWGFSASGQFDPVVFALALAATLCVHASNNVLNDVGDESGGTDRINEDRIYPYTGGSRFIQEGIMDATAMARWGLSLLAAASVAGLLLLILKGVMILYLGLAGVVLGVTYSLGPIRLSALGLGETAVAIAFGVLPVVGSAWLQSGVIDLHVILFSLPIAAWVVAILLINEVPDIDADGSTGKRTLPVRLGREGTASLYLTVHVIALAIIVLLAFGDRVPLAAPLLPLILMIPVSRCVTAIRVGIDDREGLVRAIETTLAMHTLGTLWLSGCVLFVYWW